MQNDETECANPFCSARTENPAEWIDGRYCSHSCQAAVENWDTTMEIENERLERL